MTHTDTVQDEDHYGDCYQPMTNKLLGSQSENCCCFTDTSASYVSFFDQESQMARWSSPEKGERPFGDH